MNILFIGTESAMAGSIQVAARLRWPDVTVIVEQDLDLALRVLRGQAPDVALMGSPYPQQRRSLAEDVRRLRRVSDVPLMVMGRKGVPDPEGEEVSILSVGADDYLQPSVGVLDVLARLAALMRRASRQAEARDRVITCGSLVLNPGTYEVFLRSKPLQLTPTEFRLLHLLMTDRGVVVPHPMIASSLWGNETDGSALAKKYIQRLRQKLNDTRSPWIVTVRGVGYRLVDPSSSGAEERSVDSAVA